MIDASFRHSHVDGAPQPTMLDDLFLRVPQHKWDEEQTLQDMLLRGVSGEEVDWEAIAQRVKDYPREVQTVFRGKTALQLAVTGEAPRHVVSSMILANPRACLRSAYSTSALFDACRTGAPFEVIKAILDTAVQERDAAGVKGKFSPFTWINDMQVSVKQAEFLLRHHPHGSIDRDDYLGGKCALHQIIDDFDWLIHDIAEYPGGGIRSDNLTFLYQKLKLLLWAKDSLMGDVEENSNSFLPLHSLLRYCLQEMVVMAHGRRIGSDLRGPVAVLSFLARAEPQQFSARDRWGDLPIHIVSKSQLPIGSDSRLMEGLVRLVVDAHRGGLSVKDSDGRLPLHCAIANQASLSAECCKFIFDAAPHVAVTLDPVLGMFPFQIAATRVSDCNWSDISRIQLVFSVLLEAPQAVSWELGECANTEGSATIDENMTEATQLIECDVLDADTLRFISELESSADARKRSNLDGSTFNTLTWL